MGIVLKTELAAQSAGGADSIKVLGVVSEVDSTSNLMQRAEVIAPAAGTVTGQATNNATISVRYLRDGAVVGTLASLTLANGTNLAAETPVQLTPAGSQPVLQQGDLLDVLSHQNGTGLALPAGILVELEGDFSVS